MAFAFTVMADPVSSVAYAIEAALAQLDGDLGDLALTMSLVVATIALVAATYHQLIGRFPDGGGGAEALASAFGEGWAFVPVGALLVDFTLTIAVSCAAAASAVIAAVPSMADARMPLALALVVLVAAGSALGHRGRIVFGTATIAFVGMAMFVLARGAGGDPSGAPAGPLVGDASLAAVLLAMPLGMALATGIEAPSNAIAQLSELDRAGRRLFGQLTIWMMLAIVGALTLGFAVLAVRFGVGSPGSDSTLLAEVARVATGDGVSFDLFQAASSLLLLAAAASSYLAGSGLLAALATHGDQEGGGLLPERLRRRNRFRAPPWGLAALLGLAAGLVAVTGGRDQELVHFYAAAVFASFLAALVACARLSWRDGNRVALAVNIAGVLPVVCILVMNLLRVDPIAALVAAGAISWGLHWRWVQHGRPSGLARVLR